METIHDRQAIPMTAISHLCMGSTGPEVRLLQERLSGQGADKLVVDGKFGRKTYQALRAFQKASRLRPDGVLGRLTATALGWRYRGGNPGYTVRLEKVTVPPNAPPMKLLEAVMHDGFMRYGDAMIDAVRKTGLTDTQNQKIIDDIDKIVVPAFVDVVSDFVKSKLVDIDDIVTKRNFAEMDIGSFKTTVLTIHEMYYQLGMVLKNAGGKIDAYGALYERGVNLNRIGDSAGLLLKGERESAFVAVEIKLAFDVAIGLPALQF